MLQASMDATKNLLAEDFKLHWTPPVKTDNGAKATVETLLNS